MEAFRRFEQAGWEERAAGYDRLLGRITARVVDPLLDAAGVPAGSHVVDAADLRAGNRFLDVACGSGEASARAAERGARPVGVDLSAAMVGLARSRFPAIDFRQASAEALPFAAASFDAVAGNFLLHHLAEPQVAVAECARVLAPGGRLALSVWDLPERARFVGVLVDAVAEVGAAPPADLPPGPSFFRYAESGALIDLLHAAGLTGARSTTVAFTQRLASADELWDGLIDGTVRTSATVLAQPADVRAAIRAAFNRLTTPYTDADGLAIAVSAVIASGAAPPA
ncbi:class I SAM-dependent methyltransferase [Actinoplanes sp. NPDC051861]|uniref:class I SAM-dependent methyltransferase n=1 Tax=Actinoplanes sp. NPDC051861 TaxID=3155170 RepID=UPI00342F7AA0